MPNVFVIRDPKVISKENFDKLMAFIAPTVMGVINDAGGNIAERHVRVIPTEAWEGQVHDKHLNLLIFAKRSSFTQEHGAMAHDIAQSVKDNLVMEGLLDESNSLKVNLTFVDSALVVA